jgi:SAM-dependent methyltransferase
MRFLSVQPAAESYAALYDASYFESDFRCGRCDTNSADEAAFLSENQGLLDDFATLRPPGRLLDVGCASGWLIKHALERGWEAQGVELSPNAVAVARANGLDVVEGDLISARLPAAGFDLVYLGDVLEHVPDCRTVLAEVARILAPGGFLYLRGPITTNSLARSLALAVSAVTGRPLVLREPPYHLWEFTPGPLGRLARSAGLEIVRMRQSKIPPGRAHGRKSALQRAALAGLDTVNLPLTTLFNVWGDRVVLVARRPLGAGPIAGSSPSPDSPITSR